MPRRPRVVIPGVPHHVTQRGNNRQPVFLSPGDWSLYLELLSRQSSLHGARILGYCLMPNHVHLIAVPEQEDSLARTLGRSHSEFALAMNRTQQRSGHLWQNRFFSCPLEGRRVLTALRYVELNPVRAGLVHAPWDWPWSSARAHIEASRDDPLLDSFWRGPFGHWDPQEWKDILAAAMDSGEVDALRRAIQTGEPFGSREFVIELGRQVGRNLFVGRRGRPRSKPQPSDEHATQGELPFAAGK